MQKVRYFCLSTIHASSEAAELVYIDRVISYVTSDFGQYTLLRMYGPKDDPRNGQKTQAKLPNQCSLYGLVAFLGYFTNVCF